MDGRPSNIQGSGRRSILGVLIAIAWNQSPVIK